MHALAARALLATAGAGTAAILGLAAMTPPGAAAAARVMSPSGGTPVTTDSECGVTSETATAANDTVGQSGDCAQTGYVASGADFRFAQALITVPDGAGEVDTSPTLYVALDASSATAFDDARIGVQPCTSTGGAPTCPGDASQWQVFASVDEPELGSPETVTWPVSTAAEGGGILVNVYYNGTTDSFTATLPGGTVEQDSAAVSGPVYTRAEALTDWEPAEAINGLPVVDCRVEVGGRMRRWGPAPRANPCREDQFLQGRFTTAGGARGTFKGPWTLNPVEATSDGYGPPYGEVRSWPSYLWNDGASYHGLGDDTFGTWVSVDTTPPV